MTSGMKAMDSPTEDQRFPFGKNWEAYIAGLTPGRIEAARGSLKTMLSLDRLEGKRFLDAGSGSGIFSLAGWQLGATVHSFDYDPDSVRCTDALRRQFAEKDGRWRVQQGSVLDASYLRSLGPFDIIYSWGVLHHTGNLALAMENILIPLAPGGLLCLALYNDQGWRSRYWLAVKKGYNRSVLLRPLIAAFHAPYLLGLRFVAQALRRPSHSERGMSLYHDMIDWIGGYPFEVARPEDVVAFYERRGLSGQAVRVCGRRFGCNEFVFRKP